MEEKMGPCADVVGACIFNGKLYNARFQTLNEAWIAVGVVAIVVLVIGFALIQGYRAYIGWKRG